MRWARFKLYTIEKNAENNSLNVGCYFSPCSRQRTSNTSLVRLLVRNDDHSPFKIIKLSLWVTGQPDQVHSHASRQYYKARSPLWNPGSSPLFIHLLINTKRASSHLENGCNALIYLQGKELMWEVEEIAPEQRGASHWAMHPANVKSLEHEM